MSNISVLTWNVQGRKLMYDTPFTNIMPFLESSPAEIMCLQEIPDAHRKLSLLKYIGQYYIAIPQHNNNEPTEEHNHTAILSKYPIVKTGEITYDNLKKNKPVEKSSWADLQINGKTLRLYNCHLGIRGCGIKERQEQLGKVLKHSQGHTGPKIICGDMNTLVPKKGYQREAIKFFHKIPDSSLVYQNQYCKIDERYVFPHIAEKEGFRDVTALDQTTWCIPKVKIELFGLKLDWFMVKDVKATHVEYGPYISDHRSIYVECSI